MVKEQSGEGTEDGETLEVRREPEQPGEGEPGPPSLPDTIRLPLAQDRCPQCRAETLSMTPQTPTAWSLAWPA